MQLRKFRFSLVCRAVAIGVACASLVGCLLTTADTTTAPQPARTSGAFSSLFQRGGDSPAQSSSAHAPRAWDWVTGVPSGATRAELVMPVLPESSCVALLPDWQQPEIRPASAVAQPRYRITKIQNAPVADFNQMQLAVARAQDAGKKIAVTLIPEATASRSPVTLEMEPLRLLTVSHAAAPHEGLLRVTEDGNPWLLIRHHGIRCKLMARVERQRGLLHLAVAEAVCWGEQATLPREVQASCNGVPLQCLTVAETLDALYGGRKARQAQPDAASYSFASTSEREDYLLPINYKRLQQELDQASPQSRATPALATLPGIAYPGPALLGDARALSGFLLQRQIYMPGQPERIGWLIFGGEALRTASAVQVVIDLGDGPIPAVFALPHS
jgi:hypothetical protein